MLRILADAASRPELFSWFGGIAEHDLEQWLKTAQLVLPADLLELWHLTGGGDVLETETILRPNAGAPPGGPWIPGDDTHSSNLAYREHGLSPDLYVFHEGTFVSAVDLNSQRYAVLGSAYDLAESFPSLDDWYHATLRNEFVRRRDVACP